MSAQSSFDVSTGADLQEVDNAVNHTRKEIAQRFDFKGTHCVIAFDRANATLELEADDDFHMRALYDVLQAKLVKRGVPLKNVKAGEPAVAPGGRVRRSITLTQGIPSDTARAIVKAVKEQGFKKVQVAIQGDELRVTSPSKDVLQEVIQFLRERDFDIQLTFGNYRS
ncbi:MAG TPA: YajQ family cyclic di-GMP-binding protein [Gemmatimonadales bacterium]|nr:YajQ family cyclic di-GMP-binding protein [Gemmatimonadales bacterium]